MTEEADKWKWTTFSEGSGTRNLIARRPKSA